MSEIICSVCGNSLKPNEILINQRSLKSKFSRKRYLCLQCRKNNYDQYQQDIAELLSKKKKE